MKCLAFAIALLGAARSGGAQDTNGEPYVSQAKAAVLRFMRAIEQGDADELRALIWHPRTSGARLKGRNALVDCILAQRALEEAMAAKFGDAGRAAARADAAFTPKDRDAVNTARGELRSDRLVILHLEQTRSTIVVARGGGGGGDMFGREWRIVVSAVNVLQDEDGEGGESSARINWMELITRQLNGLARDIKAGRYAKLEEARAAIAKLGPSFDEQEKR